MTSNYILEKYFSRRSCQHVRSGILSADF